MRDWLARRAGRRGAEPAEPTEVVDAIEAVAPADRVAPAGSDTPGTPDTTALAALVEEAYDAVVVTTLDGRITYWNKSAFRLYGRGRGLEVGGDLRTLVPDVVRPQLGKVLAAVAGGQLVPPFKRQHTYASGVVAVAEVAATPIRDVAGEVAGVGFFVRYAVEGMAPGDPLAIEAAEALYIGEFATEAPGEAPQHRALLRSEARYRAIVETADQGIALLDADGAFVFVNRRMTEFLGAPEEALVGERADVLLGDPLRLSQVQQTGVAQRYELFHSHPSGGTLCGLVTLSPLEEDNESGPGSALVMVSDITQIKRARDGYRPVVDELTDLANASLFYERVERAVRLAPDGSTAGVLTADIDRFRDVTAAFGADTADRLVRTVGERIAAVCPPDATVARIVGDRFAVFVERAGDNPEQLVPLAERIHASVSTPTALGTVELVPSVSIGIAMALAGDPSPVGRVVAASSTQHVADDVLRRAHAAMRAARAGGPGRTSVDEVRPLDTVAARLALVPELQRAIRNDGLTVLYQPVVALADSRPVTIDAMLRWPHAGRGMLGPDTFLPVAEESGLALDLGRWLLGHVAKDAALAHDRGVRLPVSVDVSARQVGDRRFVHEVIALLERTGLTAASFELVVAESALVDGTAAEPLATLRELGARVAVRGFGAGRTALAQWGGLPVDVVKIDAEFVRYVADSERAAALVRSAVEVAGAFGLDVVAEGVETDAQRVALTELGCPKAAGNLWASPLTHDELLHWLTG